LDLLFYISVFVSAVLVIGAIGVLLAGVAGLLEKHKKNNSHE